MSDPLIALFGMLSNQQKRYLTAKIMQNISQSSQREAHNPDKDEPHGDPYPPSDVPTVIQPIPTQAREPPSRGPSLEPPKKKKNRPVRKDPVDNVAQLGSVIIAPALQNQRQEGQEEVNILTNVQPVASSLAVRTIANGTNTVRGT